MSGAWYLHQNLDVKYSGINPFVHYLKYGRRELRSWREPRWYKKALRQNGWIINKSTYFIKEANLEKNYLNEEYKDIKIHRYGVYNNEIKELKIKFKLINSKIIENS